MKLLSGPKSLVAIAIALTCITSAVRSQIAITAGPSVSYMINPRINNILSAFNSQASVQTPFKMQRFATGLNFGLDFELDNGLVLSLFTFHYEGMKNSAFASDTLYSYNYDYKHSMTAVGVLNALAKGENGVFVRLDLICFGKQKLRLTTKEVQHFAGDFTIETTTKTIWNNTLFPSWTPGIVLGKEGKFYRIQAQWQAVIPRTPSYLARHIGLEWEDHPVKVGYSSLSVSLMLRLGGR